MVVKHELLGLLLSDQVYRYALDTRGCRYFVCYSFSLAIHGGTLLYFFLFGVQCPDGVVVYKDL